MERLLDELADEVGLPNDDYEGRDKLERLLKRTVREVLDLTRRSYLEEGMEGVVIDLAIINYNRRGTEGEQHRSEGGLSTTFIFPSNLKDRLKRWRNGRLRML